MSVHSTLTSYSLCLCACLRVGHLEKVKKLYVCCELCKVFSEASVFNAWAAWSIWGICRMKHPYWLSDAFAALRTRVSARGTNAYSTNYTSPATSNNATQQPDVMLYYSIVQSSGCGNKKVQWHFGENYGETALLSIALTDKSTCCENLLENSVCILKQERLSHRYTLGTFFKNSWQNFLLTLRK